MSKKHYRVTSILEPFIDFSHIPPSVLENASDRGTRVHDYCSRYAMGGIVVCIDDDCKPYFKSFKQWFDQFVKEVHISEVRFYSDLAKLTGKLDLFCKVEGISEGVLIDLKTPQ
ncbi:MAG: hypothetical protein KAR20_21060, partial [Candidatus Heimdallarchaeota archaeon]|nr:hypothetical protein [Candidatus Heimdallarchaeota archaeon]